MKIKTATLLNCDCMEYLRGLPDKAFDLAIVDPPYGIGESGGTNKSRGKLAEAKDYKPFLGGDIEPASILYFDELSRVSCNQIIWGANHFMNRINRASPCWIVWDKQNGGTDFSDSELAFTSFTSAVRNFKFRWSGMLQGDMKNKEHRIHPTQKPVKLYEWLLTNYAKPGQKILDTHGGSMSSVIAAIKMGFEITCCELDENYFASAVQRVEDAQRQAVLL